MLLLLESGNYNEVARVFFFIMLIPAMFLAIIGFVIRKKNKKASKVLYILAVTYTIILTGICGSAFS